MKKIATLTLFLCIQVHGMQQRALAELKFFAKLCPWAYVVIEGDTVAHELGHALAGKALWGSPIDITIGAEASEKITNAPIFTLGGIKFQSFALRGGYTNLTYTEPRSAASKLAVTAAGPLAGFAFYTCMFMGFNKIYHQRARLLFSLTASALGSLAPSLYPSSETSDGAKIYKIYLENFKKRN